MDGTLISSDLLYEATFKAIGQNPLVLFRLPLWLMSGKAGLKEKLACRVTPNPRLLPYRAEVLDFLKQERSSGRKLVLITASPRPWAEEVARHVGLFDDVIATENGRNIKGRSKLRAIRSDDSQPAGFGYIGDSRADMPVWREADQIYAVGSSQRMKRRLQGLGKETVFFDVQRPLVGPSLTALRPHHWAKNLLLFLPLFLAHSVDKSSLFAVFLGFVAFSAAASATYVVNDLIDIEADRTHPEKRNRPFASGRLPCQLGPALIAALLLLCMVAALPLPRIFWIGLAGYLLLTTLYSFWLKRKVLVDVFTLAGLYTFRIIAGGWTAGVEVSNWLLGFSIFIFTSLAFAKRGTELHQAPIGEGGFVRGRGYGREDLSLVKQLGVSSAYCSVLLLALYISGDKVVEMYSHPNFLWLLCPVLMYWLSRVWMKVHRGLMHHDPLMEASKDPISLLCGVLIFTIVVVAG
jgi:4-hydroxybenzoate polyprenyltransferase